MMKRISAKGLASTHRGRAVGVTAVGLGGYALYTERHGYAYESKANEQFHTSSSHPVPPGCRAWQIRNDYPTSSMLKSQKTTSGSHIPTLALTGLGDDFQGQNAPWLTIDYEKNPEEYAEAIKRYCFEGMIPATFRPQENRVRNWYHAPWMHYRAPNATHNEREPLSGLTFERVTPKYELARSQDTWLQNWACGFYNATGESFDAVKIGSKYLK
ncbi:hypothetical protein F66182_4239 [Fusarium sp. NRRL 66182]|nr:hypothetical protein F66182_4239 [Fusarium sp. NRRL 66182]